MLQSNLADAELTIGLRQAANDIGLALDPLMERVGLNPRMLDSPEGFISWTRWNQLLEDIAEQEQCGHFGLLIARHQPPISLGLMGQIMKLCPDVGTAIAKAQQYATTYTHTVFWETYVADGFITLNRKMHHQLGGPLGQCSSYSLAQCYKAMQTLCGEGWRPVEVRFVHPEPKPASVRFFRNFFKVPVYFSQTQDCLVFAESDFVRPIATADAQLLGIVEAHANSLQQELSAAHDFSDLARFLIRKSISNGSCDINMVAGLLDLHPKTLHRRLKVFGLTFKDMINEERHRLAQFYLLKSEIGLNELAEILGYSEASAMSRAFKRISGESPTQWRERQQPKIS